jgi:hypothetical protein
MVGAVGDKLIVNVCAGEVPIPFVAVTDAVNVPFTEGVPEINPVDVLMLNPAGNPVAA